LLDHFGAGASLAVLTFGAFLAGSIWSEMIPNLIRRLHWLVIVIPVQKVRIWKHGREGLIDKTIEFINNLPTWDDSRFLAGDYRRSIDELVRSKMFESVNSSEAFKSAVRSRLYVTEYEQESGTSKQEILSENIICRTIDIDRHVQEIIGGAKRIPVRLLGKEMEIWNSWDRLRAEGEFRCSLATAGAVLVASAVHGISPLWVLLTPIILILWSQGERKFRAAFAELYEALIAERVSIKELERISDHEQLHWLRAVREPLSEAGKEVLATSSRIQRQWKEYDEWRSGEAHAKALKALHEQLVRQRDLELKGGKSNNSVRDPRSGAAGEGGTEGSNSRTETGDT